MSRRITLQLDAIVSDDGTRCAAECPHRDGGYGHCTAFDKPLVLDLGHGAYDRCPTCIAAEQAAASVPSCETQAVCADCGRPAACVGRYWGMTEDAYACDICCGHGNEDGRCRPVEAAYAAPHLDGGARALDASEALREVRAALGVPSTNSDTAAFAAFLAQGYRIVRAERDDLRLCASEALREARVQGMREGWRLAAFGGTSNSLYLEDAIEAVRKGER